MLEIGAPPEHFLQGVKIVSCSSNLKNDNQSRITVIKCAEVLGKVYNQHKALGAAKEVLVKLRVKAVDLLRQARSMPEVGERSAHLEYTYIYGSQSTGVDVQSVKQVVRDSGQQALADLLALVVMNPSQCLLSSQVAVIYELYKYCHNDIPGPSSQSRPLQVPPFKEAIASLLERSKNDVKEMASVLGDIRTVRTFLQDLKACYQALGDETAFTTFVRDLASMLRNADIQRHRELGMPSDMAWDREDVEEYLEQEEAHSPSVAAAIVGDGMDCFQ